MSGIGTGDPHGGVGGYEDPPQYVYDPGQVGTYPDLPSGQVPACDGSSANPQPAWINLDEMSQIGLNVMFAGVGDTQTFPGQQILFMAKANHAEYDYLTQNRWFDTTSTTCFGTIARSRRPKAAIW